MARLIIQYSQDDGCHAGVDLVYQTRSDHRIQYRPWRVARSQGLHAGDAGYVRRLEASEKLDPKISCRKVRGIDIEIRSHNRAAIEAHPMASRIQMIQGSSISSEIIEQVRAIATNYLRVQVGLGSNKTHNQVLAELQAYAPLTSVGSYFAVFDTFVEDMPKGFFPSRPWDPGNNTGTSVWKYLKIHLEFEFDKSLQHKQLITSASHGYLKRVRLCH